MDFAQRMRTIREEKGLSQHNFALALNISPTHVSKLEAGKSNPSDMLIKTISLVFDINEEWLRTGHGRKESPSTATYNKLIDTIDEKNQDLRNEHVKRDLHEAQFKQLQLLFAPAFPRLYDMIALLSHEKARGFVQTLNLLIQEWGGRSDEDRLRLQFKLEDLIPNFNEKRAALGAATAPTIAAGRMNRVMVPVVGRAAAGAPIEMIENDLGSFDAGCDVRFGDFAVYAVGDSMIEAGIKDGDLCIIRPQETVENGEIALVAVGDESTIKRFYKDNGSYRLMPCNATYAPFKYGPETPIRVLGKFIKVVSA